MKAVRYVLMVGVIGAAFACGSFGADSESTPLAVEAGAPDADAAVLDAASADSGAPCVAGTVATDPHHCGRCGHDCLGGACDKGRCVPLVVAASQPEVRSIAVDNKEAVWVTSILSGQILACSHAGCGGAPTALATGIPFPRGVAVAPGNVFWTEPMTADISRCVRSTCASSKTLMNSTGGGDEIATDKTTVWATRGGGGQAITTCSIATSVCTVTTNANGGPPGRLAAANGVAFFTSPAGELRRIVGAAGTISDVLDGASRLAGAFGIAAAPDGSKAFFVNTTTGVISTAVVGPGAAQVPSVALITTATPQSIAFDGKALYWTTFGQNGLAGSVFSCDPTTSSTCTSTLVELATGVRPYAIALDDVSVYYSTLGTSAAVMDGAVMRVAKP